MINNKTFDKLFYALRSVALFAVFSVLLFAAPTTRIQDTLVKADGSLFTGTIEISWPLFQTQSGETVPADSKKVYVRNGVLDIYLIPHSGYTVTYSAGGRSIAKELWNVAESSSALKVSDIRTMLQAGEVLSVNGKVGVVVINKSDVGLGNVDNTSDMNKPVSTAQQAAINAIGTTTPAANVVPKTGAGGTLDPGFIPSLNYASLSGSYANPTWITSFDWNKLINVPAQFTPASHTHAYTDVLSAPWPTYSSGTSAPSGGCTAPAIYAETTSNPDVMYHCVAGAWQQIGGTGGSVTWGTIGGTLSAQADLQGALDGKAAVSHTHDSTYVRLSGSYSNPTWLTSLDWSKLTSVPLTFPPDTHNHDTLYPRLDGAYSNPTWLSSLAWSKLTGVPSTFTPSAHASSHKNGGADEIATATPGANAIPKAGIGGTLASGWIPDLSGVYSVVSHNHSGVYAPASHTHNYTDVLSAPWPSYSSGTSAPSGGCTAPAIYAETTSNPDVLYHCVSGSWQQIGGSGGSSLPAYTGKSLYTLKVTSDETAVEWILDTTGAGLSKTRVGSSDVWAVDSMQIPYLALDNSFLGGQVFGGKVQFLERAIAAGTAANQHELGFDTDGLLKSREYGGSVVTYYSTANPPTDGTTVSNSGATGASVLKTGTNVTARKLVAGSNVTIQENTDDITISASGGGASVAYITMPAANCQMGAAGTGFALPASLYPTPGCATGSNTMVGYLEWPDADGDYYAQAVVPLMGTISSINVSGKWRTSATTGDVVIQLQTACFADGESVDPSWNTAQTITDTAAGTTLLANDFSLTGLIITGCSSGETMLLKVLRNRTHASDTLAASFQLLSLSLTINR